MNLELFLTSLAVTVGVVLIAMLYLRRATRRMIVTLCESDSGAEFWLKSADVLAMSGSLMLVLIFGNATSVSDWTTVLRLTLSLALAGIFITVMFVSSSVWRNVDWSAASPVNKANASD